MRYLIALLSFLTCTSAYADNFGPSPVQVQSGSTIYRRLKLRLISGITMADNPSNNSVDLTAAGGGGGIQTGDSPTATGVWTFSHSGTAVSVTNTLSAGVLQAPILQTAASTALLITSNGPNSAPGVVFRNNATFSGGSVPGFSFEDAGGTRFLGYLPTSNGVALVGFAGASTILGSVQLQLDTVVFTNHTLSAGASLVPASDGSGAIGISGQAWATGKINALSATTVGPDASDQHALPTGTDALVSIGATQTLTNKSIAASEINSGTVAIAQGGTNAATTSQNFAFIGPTSGSGAPSFRLLVAGDVPSLSSSYCALTGCTMSGAITETGAFAGGTSPPIGHSMGTTTAAANGAQQYTPYFELLANGWNTSSSQTVGMHLTVEPQQAATIGVFGTWGFRTTTAGSYADSLQFGTDTAGNPRWSSTGTTLNYYTSSGDGMMITSGTGNLSIGAGAILRWTSTTFLPFNARALDIGTSGNPFRRLFVGGTTQISGNIVLGAGWGSTASVGTLTGVDAHVQYTITSGGISIAVNPTVTITFRDGTFTTIPTCKTEWNGTSDVTLAGSPMIKDAPTATTDVITVGQGTGFTSVTAQTYSFVTWCTGGN